MENMDLVLCNYWFRLGFQRLSRRIAKRDSVQSFFRKTLKPFGYWCLHVVERICLHIFVQSDACGNGPFVDSSRTSANARYAILS